MSSTSWLPKPITKEGIKAYIPFRGGQKWMKMFIYLPEEAQVVLGWARGRSGSYPRKLGCFIIFSSRLPKMFPVEKMCPSEPGENGYLGQGQL